MSSAAEGSPSCTQEWFGRSDPVPQAAPVDPLNTPGMSQPRLPASLPERYRVLLDIGHTLTGTLSAEDLYRAIYRETARVLEAAGFYISLYDVDRDEATVVFYADQGRERRVHVRFRGSESQVIREGVGSIIPDRVDAHSLLILGEDNTEITRSAISAPLRHTGRVIGAISCQSYRPGAFTDADLELLQGIADVAAVAIENARFVEELEVRRREAERLEEIGRALTSSLEPEEVIQRVVDASLELLEADSTTLWLLEGDAARVAAFEGVSGLALGAEWQMSGEIFEDLGDLGRPILVPDLRHSELLPEAVRARVELQSAIVAPLLIGDRVIGALSTAYVSRHAFTDEEIRVARRLASQASIALANARLHERLQDLSLKDPLTGLPNRRHLEIHLERELAAARRGRPLCLVIFDLDRFKIYNDTHGHVAGDAALRRLGNVLASGARAMNVVARYGGDEFVSVLAGSTPEEAVQHARRIQGSVEADPVLMETGMSLSYGIGQYDRSMKSIDDLIRAADNDLYRAKSERGPGWTRGGFPRLTE